MIKFLKWYIPIVTAFFLGGIAGTLVPMWTVADPAHTITGTVDFIGNDLTMYPPSTLQTFVCEEEGFSICSAESCFHPTTTIELVDGRDDENETPAALGLTNCTLQ